VITTAFIDLLCLSQFLDLRQALADDGDELLDVAASGDDLVAGDGQHQRLAVRAALAEEPHADRRRLHADQLAAGALKFEAQRRHHPGAEQVVAVARAGLGRHH
jgi:hypothetical protein